MITPSSNGGASSSHSEATDFVAVVRNTFVDMMDVSAQDVNRQLRPLRSCSDMPEPFMFKTGFDLVAPAPLAPSLERASEEAASNRQCSKASIPILPGWGVKAVIKNTFVEIQDIDDEEMVPRRRSLQRAASMPDNPAYTGGSCPLESRKRSRFESELTESLSKDAQELLIMPRAVKLKSCSSTFHPWTVDARKLRGNYKQVVSPPLDVHMGNESVTFRLIIAPSLPTSNRGGGSFQKSKGWGTVQVKCEAALPDAIAEMTYRVWLGSGDKTQAPRGPNQHNFAQNAISELPRSNDQWNFSAAVDEKTNSFTLCLEQLPTEDMPAVDAVAEETMALPLAPAPASAVTPPSMPEVTPLKPKHVAVSLETPPKGAVKPERVLSRNPSQATRPSDQKTRCESWSSQILASIVDADFSSSDDSSDEGGELLSKTFIGLP